MTKAKQFFYFLISQIFSTEHNNAQGGGLGNRGWLGGSWG